ncbi:MAG: RNA methyltransferase [Oscillospiraceae bacterium]|nr:RNA methyltransferase [Oscillospiraceae bacterium]
MEHLTSRKSAAARHFRLLARDDSCRRESREYLCEGLTALCDALNAKAEIRRIVWCGNTPDRRIPVSESVLQYTADKELFDYLCPLQNAPGPLFTVALRQKTLPETIRTAVVLENVQDPGNVGTVIRTANAFGIDAVLLTGSCASPYNPKTVRATMGAIFRQPLAECSMSELIEILEINRLRLLGAALTSSASDIRNIPLDRCAVAIGSEGGGLSNEMLASCNGEVIIPMQPESESLNAAVAASVCMWEMVRNRE